MYVEAENLSTWMINFILELRNLLLELPMQSSSKIAFIWITL